MLITLAKFVLFYHRIPNESFRVV